MVFYSNSDLMNQLMLYKERFDLDLDGKPISECIGIVIDACPQLHSLKELEDYAIRNLKKIEAEYGYKGLRLWYYDYVKDDLLESFTGRDSLQKKYSKLIKHIHNYHSNELLEFVELQLDYYNYARLLEKVYKENYGVITDYNNNLYALIKTIHNTGYDKNIVSSLQELLFTYLKLCGDKYYVAHDLTDIEVLDMLYEHILEESCLDEEMFKGETLFYEYDGFGNEYLVTDYMSSWSDEKGYHSRFYPKKSSISDYKLRGGC